MGLSDADSVSRSQTAACLLGCLCRGRMDSEQWLVAAHAVAISFVQHQSDTVI